jgi:hypothetical protein
MARLNFDIIDLEEPEEPEGGWDKSCVIADHQWELVIEEGIASISATDPCSEEKAKRMEWPVCRQPYWEREDLAINFRLPVKVTHIDDSSPAGPWGPAEYGFYIEVELIP